MNKIIFFRNNNGHIKRFEVSGHTDFDLNGSDVLCAAVSTLVSHTIGSVQEFTDEPCINIVDEDIPKVVFASICRIFYVFLLPARGVGSLQSL